MNMQRRKSTTYHGKIYFWTATIHKWYNLLANNGQKETIMGSLKTLSDKNLITIIWVCYYAQSYSFDLEAKCQQWQRNPERKFDEIYCS